MDFHLSHEQIALQKTVRDFAAKEIAPLAIEIDRDARFPAETFKKLADMGLLGLLIPKGYGGRGDTVLACCVVSEEIARACASTSMSYLTHSVLFSHNLTCNGSEEQKKKYLPDAAAGKTIGAIAMTEPNAGSDVLSIETSGARDGDDYIINGRKTFITNAPVADVFLVYVRTDKNLGSHGISQFIIEKGRPGFSVGKPFQKMGMRGSPTGELFFENCRVPAKNLVKGENKALGILMGGLDVERTVGGAMAVGLAQAAFERALVYARTRQQFGQLLIMFEMIAEKLANMSMEIEASRLLTYKAATLCDEGVRCSAEASHAKLFASETSVRVACEAVQILGGYGYMKENEVERMMRDAKLGTIGGGTSEIQRLIIAREVVKRSMA
ncbi:MAG: acyl-CoA dehydrogenase family protein [Candidatus Hydrogenedentes bacterium]|nr:acyl-CoA dehydrogenase family protein [Candidatus Hydrogenedentota bacterium]